MKKKIISMLLATILLFCLTISVCADYVGSVKSDIYHYSDCYWAKQISSYNKIWFKNVTQARNYGYRACYVCNPPSSSYTSGNYTYEPLPTYTPSIIATDIRTYVNGFEIPTFAYSGDDRNGKNSCIVVLAEDLAGYGFDVEWNPQTKMVYVADNDYKALNPIPMKYYRSFKTGAKVFDIVKNTVVPVSLKVNNKTHYVYRKYTLNGYVAIDVDELANVAQFSWDGYNRTVSIISR